MILPHFWNRPLTVIFFLCLHSEVPRNCSTSKAPKRQCKGASIQGSSCLLQCGNDSLSYKSIPMNNQQIDRIINFYRINHQFHEPYQFLMDGNFIRLLVEKELDLKWKFEQSIKGKCTLRVTSCIIRELELLG